MSKLSNFVWSIADQLRGMYKPAQYGSVVLPMTILRRMECLLEPHKADVVELAGTLANPDHLDVLVRKQYGLNFYNTSAYDLKSLLGDPENLAANLVEYLCKFSPNVADIFERYGFEKQIAKLDEKDRLYLIVEQFSNVDLHPDTVSNTEMGSLFEDLIRRFAAASNETAGEHFTPRDAIHLMVDLLFASDSEALTQPGVVRTGYDPTAGTGGMLSVAEEHLLEQNPQARFVMAGQELNDESYAICKSDMVVKGQDVHSIRLGDTLANDLHEGKTYDYCLSNPPYGGDWKASEKAVREEHTKLGFKGRFGPGLPKVSDGQMLFLQHLVAKMRPAKDGGGRAGIVLNGAPLFNGAAGSGESEIRRWLLETDLVDAIVALPTNMFYNTGIATYIWILDNNKPADRRGKVQLIDGSGFFTKMKRNLGDKSREVSPADRDRVVTLYDAYEHNEHSKIFSATDFGYWTITVERPLRLNFACTPDRVSAALGAKQLAAVDNDTLRSALGALGDTVYTNHDKFLAELHAALKDAGVTLGAPALKALWVGLSDRDDTADICTDKQGNWEPDPSLRDTENVPFGPAAEPQRDATIADHYAQEIAPHAPDAWVDYAKTKVGYEIPFTRHFYAYVPPRNLEEIDAELNGLVGEIIGLLQEVEQ